MTNLAVQIRLLGPLTVVKNGAELQLPASRKMRALLAFLATAPGSVTRSRLCELLWDAPSDPRGELRWSLSKLRNVLDDPDHSRIVAQGESVALDLSGCHLDVSEITRAARAGLEKRSVGELRSLLTLFIGEFVEGLELERHAQFSSWLNTQRRQFHTLHAAVLEQLAARLADTDLRGSLEYLERWVQLTPFDERAHTELLNRLVRCGRVEEAEEHLRDTIRLFEVEGLNWLSIREAWMAVRRRGGPRGEQHVRGTGGPQGHPDVGANVAAISVESVACAKVESTLPQRASIAVMPFVDGTADAPTRGGLADGLTEDIITRLAKLRVLFVIARGTVFALGERNIPIEEAGRLLNVDYVASGSVRRRESRIVVTAELAEARIARIVWADEFTCKADEVFTLFDEIGNRIVASVAEQIEAAERNRAILKPPNSLNAWEAYHRGLWHMYRFSRDDNERAAHYFQVALTQDRTFARAYAGLSFTHFQNAFLHRAADRPKEIDRAFEAASSSLGADDRDPAAHWAMGRALWLRGLQEESLVELDTSVALSPNFALSHYTRGFVHSQSGDAGLAIASTDHSRHLSPFDPLLFAMLGTRAIALLRLGKYQEAADWGVKAVNRPNAHAHILAIAANCLAAAARVDEARALVAGLHARAPQYRLDDFLSAFRFAPDAVRLFKANAATIGL